MEIKLNLTAAQVKLLKYYLKSYEEREEESGCNQLMEDEVKSMGLSKSEWESILEPIFNCTSIDLDPDAVFKEPTDMSTFDPILWLQNEINNQLPLELKG